MFGLDLTITLTGLLALCAIVSPIITAVINNCHDTKLKKMEFKQKERENTILYQRKVFENFLSSAGSLLMQNRVEAFMEYGKWYAQTLLYAPEDLKEDLYQLNNLIGYEGRLVNREAAKQQLSKVAVELRKVLRKL